MKLEEGSNDPFVREEKNGEVKYKKTCHAGIPHHHLI
jgi:hypothetical protein